MNIDMEVEKIAEQLPEGSVQRILCPKCQGGTSAERTFTVGRDADRVWFKCFRAGCAVSGMIGAYNLAPSIANELTRALERLNPYVKPIRLLEQSDIDYFTNRFQIDPVGVVGTTDDDEYILPVKGPTGNLRGHVVRQPVWKGTPRAPRVGRATYWDVRDEAYRPVPKTVLYCASAQPMLAWYKPRLADGGRRLVLVEDQISAIKVAKHAGQTAVALLGNGLNVEGVRDLIRWKPSTVIIALDPGAEGAAQSIAKKWGLYFERTRVVALEADPKDIPAIDLAEELGL